MEIFYQKTSFRNLGSAERFFRPPPKLGARSPPLCMVDILVISELAWRSSWSPNFEGNFRHYGDLDFYWQSCKLTTRLRPTQRVQWT